MLHMSAKTLYIWKCDESVDKLNLEKVKKKNEKYDDVREMIKKRTTTKTDK